MTILKSINPYTKELNAEIETIDKVAVTKVIDTAHEAYLSWKDTSFEERKTLFHKLADEIEKDIDDSSKLQTIEMGMLFSSSKAWMQKTADLTRWFADNTEDILWEKSIQTSGFDGVEIYDSLWVIFLTKYLSENWFSKKINQLHLVSWVFNNKGQGQSLWNFNLIDVDKLSGLEDITEKIFIYHSKDDPCVPYEHAKKYLKYLPNAEFLSFEDRGHFLQPEFPELIDNINVNI